MTTADLLYGALPMALTGAAIIGMLYRLFTRPIPMTARLERSPAGGWGSIPVRWGLGAVVGLHVTALLVPSWLAGWNAAPARLYLLEGLALAVSLWVLVGVVVHLVAFTRNPGRVSFADAAVVVGLVVLLVTGVLTALVDRWATYWGAEVAVPYVRSLFGGSPRPDLMGSLPVLAGAHTIAGFVTIAAFPFSRWMVVLAAPARAVSGFVRDMVAPPRVAPAGSWLRWGPAWLRAAVIAAYFVVGVVVIPSQVLERMGSVPPMVADLVASGLSLGALAVGLLVLRWAQRKARI
jgi:nitrate reductase gamma subunit